MERFEQQTSGSVMAQLALDRASPANWIDEVFQVCWQRQYPRELLLPTLGIRPSLHAAARKISAQLPVKTIQVKGYADGATDEHMSLLRGESARPERQDFERDGYDNTSQGYFGTRFEGCRLGQGVSPLR